MTDASPPPPGEPGDAADVDAQLAAFWRRGLALLIDVVILGVVSGVVFTAMGGDIPSPGEAQDAGDVRGLALTVLGIGLLYIGLLNGSPRGQTAGKAALGVQVRDADTGGPIGPARGLIRFGVVWLLYQLLIVPAVVDSLFAFVDPRRQSWHDKAARSIVVDLQES